MVLTRTRRVEDSKICTAKSMLLFISSLSLRRDFASALKVLSTGRGDLIVDRLSLSLTV